MPARLAFPWIRAQLYAAAGADRDKWARLRVDEALGDDDAAAELRRGELALLTQAGGEIG
jgi:hypothetical protein